MRLQAGQLEEYQRRHAQLWPELAAALRCAGILGYSIFLDESTLTLFAVQDLADDHTTTALAALPVMRRWWAWMAPLMEVHADDSPVCEPLREVFRLEPADAG